MPKEPKKEHKEEHKKRKEQKEEHKESKTTGFSLPKLIGILVVITVIAVIVVVADPNTSSYVKSLFGGDIVEAGDNVTVSYKLTVDGETYDQGVFSYITGEDQVIEGFDENIIGMRTGEKKVFTVSPEKGYGEYDPTATQPWPLTQEIEDTFNVTEEEFVAGFGEDPVEGESYEVATLPWELQVLSIENGTVFLKHLAIDGYVEDLEFGQTTISLNDDMIAIKLDPIIGSKFTTIYGPYGFPTIISANETHMILDYNHPLAGKTLLFEVEVLDAGEPENQSEITTS